MLYKIMSIPFAFYFTLNALWEIKLVVTSISVRWKRRHWSKWNLNFMSWSYATLTFRIVFLWNSTYRFIEKKWSHLFEKMKSLLQLIVWKSDNILSQWILISLSLQSLGVSVLRLTTWYIFTMPSSRITRTMCGLLETSSMLSMSTSHSTSSWYTTW